MTRVGQLRSLNQQIKAVMMLEEGNVAWSEGRLRVAFRSFLKAGEKGLPNAYSLVGYFYDDGLGTRVDKREALRWYRRAYAHGDRTAANNIGVIWKQRKNLKRALIWFTRALELGDGDAELEIAKIHLQQGRSRRALFHLQRTRRNKWATDGSREEAAALFSRLSQTGGIKER